MPDLTFSITQKTNLPSNISQELIDRIRMILIEEAFIIQEIAKDLCPVKTGRLQMSISVDETGEGIKIFSPVEYAPYQEFGTQYIEGKFFFKTALEMRQPEIDAKVSAVIEEYFRSIGAEKE